MLYYVMLCSIKFLYDSLSLIRQNVVLNSANWLTIIPFKCNVKDGGRSQYSQKLMRLLTLKLLAC